MNLLQTGVSIDRYLFRFIIMGLVIAFIASEVFWAGRLFARIWNFPELRHQAIVQHSSGSNLDLAQLRVENLGFGPAENVLIHAYVNTSDSRIHNCQINAQELYEIKTLDLKRGVINIWLDRFAPGASVEITIPGENLSQERIQLSAASDQGTSAASEEQTFSEQIGEYAGSTRGLLGEAWYIVKNSEAIQEVSEWISTKPSLASYLEVVKSYEFHRVGHAVLMLVVIVGVFFRRKHFVFATTIGIWFLIWLFFYNLEIPLNVIIMPVGFLAVVWFYALISESIDEKWVTIPLTFLALGGIVFLIYWYWYLWVSISWLIGIPVAIFVPQIIRWAEILPPLSREKQDSGT